MFILIRAVVYATAFVGLLLVFVPAQLLDVGGHSAAGQHRRAADCRARARRARRRRWSVWCTVVRPRGKARRQFESAALVVTGPYRYMRNPMYFGAALAIAGAALFYQSVQLLAYASVFLLFFHFFVVFYEEPALQRTFGEEYDTYRRQVGRWGPSAS